MTKIKVIFLAFLVISLTVLSGCDTNSSQQSQDAVQVNSQQEQYAIGQPVPVYNWSLERELLIQLYNIRNQNLVTHSVWRSDFGTIEGDCPSMGYGIPYDTSLTNPLMATGRRNYALTSISQPEPNGVFASTNTAATWVMCTNDFGQIEPHYIEAKVTVYPYIVSVDYETNRAIRAGEASVTIETSR